MFYSFIPSRKSLIRRLYAGYLIISFFTILIFCLVWYFSTSNQLIQQGVGYNALQLEALSTHISEQYDSLKSAQRRLYLYKTSANKPVYDAVNAYLNLSNATQTTSLQRQEMQQHLNEFIMDMESTSSSDSYLFMMTGIDHPENHIYLSRDSSLYGHNKGLSSSFRKKICEFVQNDTSASRSRRSIFTLPISLQSDSKQSPVHAYVLYDEIRDVNDPSVTNGYIIKAYNATEPDNVWKSFEQDLTGIALVLDMNGQILYSSNGEHFGEIYSSFDSLPKKQDFQRNQNGLRTTVYYNPSHNLYVVGEIHEREFIAQNSSSYLLIIQTAILLCGLSLVISSIAMSTTSQRIGALLTTLRQAHASIQVRAPIHNTQDELDVIAQSINDMLDQIEQHIQDCYILEIEQQNSLLHQRDAEIYALQSQINPHFLYNMLETIRMKALSHKDEDVAMMIQSLATSFRERIKGSSVILLKQELSFCENLTEIYNMRYDSEIDLVIDVHPTLLVTPVLRDLLTPILENIMIHAFHFEEDSSDFSIQISGYSVQDDLIIEVSDNGVGMLQSEVQELLVSLEQPLLQSNQYHIGLRNIQGRIRLIYGDDYGISISSTKGLGTTITLRTRAVSIEELNELVRRQL